MDQKIEKYNYKNHTNLSLQIISLNYNNKWKKLKVCHQMDYTRKL